MKQSAGILLYRYPKKDLEFLLVHPGGPFWARKDVGVWSIPKGEPMEGEDLFKAAQREFLEETGHPAQGNFVALHSLKQKSGKLVHAWAAEGDLDAATVRSNEFEMEWPPGSGKQQSFPEVDRAGWFTVKEALIRILPSQQGFITELQSLLAGNEMIS